MYFSDHCRPYSLRMYFLYLCDFFRDLFQFHLNDLCSIKNLFFIVARRQHNNRKNNKACFRTLDDHGLVIKKKKEKIVKHTYKHFWHCQFQRMLSNSVKGRTSVPLILWFPAGQKLFLNNYLNTAGMMQERVHRFFVAQMFPEIYLKKRLLKKKLDSFLCEFIYGVIRRSQKPLAFLFFRISSSSPKK